MAAALEEGSSASTEGASIAAAAARDKAVHTPWRLRTATAVFIGLSVVALLVGTHVAGLGVGVLPKQEHQADERRLDEQKFVDKVRFWCGGHDPAVLNDFGADLATMEYHGWVFSKRGGTWDSRSSFRPPLHNICDKAGSFVHTRCAQPASESSYWGWDYPGNGVIRLPLSGHGKLTLDVGNLYYEGQVIVAFDGLGVVAAIGANTPSSIITTDFYDGWMLTIAEDNPRAIIAINSISFQCSAPVAHTAPGNLKVHKGAPQFAAGAQWKVADVHQDCKKYCVLSSEEAVAWGSDAALSFRQFCATSTLFQKAEGFLYPDPGDEDKPVCKVMSKNCAKDAGDMCDLDFDKYAAFVLTDRHPFRYPKHIHQ